MRSSRLARSSCYSSSMSLPALGAPLRQCYSRAATPPALRQTWNRLHILRSFSSSRTAAFYPRTSVSNRRISIPSSSASFSSSVSSSRLFYLHKNCTSTTSTTTSTTPPLLQTRHCSNSSSSTSSSNGPPTTTRDSSTNKWHNMASEDVVKYLKQTHDKIFENNKKWAEQKATNDPGYFARLSEGQTPEYLWIGCSDSRIPAEQITGLEPGETFVHRNIANLVVNTDLNVMSVINYAVRHLGVKHIIVCGHYGCGGVKAAMTPKDLGLLNPWLRNIRDVYRLHEEELDAIADDTERYNRLVELNVVEQCRNIIKTAAVQQSYAKNEFPIVHGWVFNFHDGLLKDLKIDFEAMLAKIQKLYNLTE